MFQPAINEFQAGDHISISLASLFIDKWRSGEASENQAICTYGQIIRSGAEDEPTYNDYYDFYDGDRRHLFAMDGEEVRIADIDYAGETVYLVNDIYSVGEGPFALSFDEFETCLENDEF